MIRIKFLSDRYLGSENKFDPKFGQKNVWYDNILEKLFSPKFLIFFEGGSKFFLVDFFLFCNFFWQKRILGQNLFWFKVSGGKFVQFFFVKKNTVKSIWPEKILGQKNLLVKKFGLETFFFFFFGGGLLEFFLSAKILGQKIIMA